MDKLHIGQTISLVAVIGVAIGVFMANLDNRQLIEDQRKELDSLHTYQQTLKVMAKTLTVAYPQLSAYEAKYYANIFYDFAFQYKADWTWYPAMIRAESNWNHTLISESKARGVIQIIPVCASAQAKKLGIRYKEGYTEWNEFNCLAMGLDYLSQGFDSTTEYAVKRYIGGPGFDQASDSNKVKIEKYEKKVSAERAKIDSVFQEHTRLYYMSKGIASEVK